MDLNFKRRARERGIAAEVANALYEALRPAMDAAGPAADPAAFMEQNRGLIAHLFGLACERHHLATEAEATRVLNYIPQVLADLRRGFDRLKGQVDDAVSRLK